MLKTKFYFNEVELKDGMILKFELSSPLGIFTKELPIKIENNQLYAVHNGKDLWEVDCFTKPLEIIQ